MSINDICHICSDFAAHFTNVYGPINQHESPFFCSFYIQWKITCVYSGSFLILAMSCDRFFAAYYPISYKERISKGRLAKAAAFCVLISFFSAFLMTVTHVNEDGFCAVQRSGVDEIILLLAMIQSSVFHMVIPSLLTAILNLLIALKIRRRSVNHRFVIIVFNLPSIPWLIKIAPLARIFRDPNPEWILC